MGTSRDRLLFGIAASVTLFAAESFVPATARACGCFAPPDVANPIVQTGERIVFARRGTKVVAHIQIQYSGTPEEFAWFLPLPSEPSLALSTEELFDALELRTAPSYVTYRNPGPDCGPTVSFGCSSSDAASESAGPGFGDKHVVLRQSSAGPYDYAVLRADTKEPMLEWLAANRFFVPAGTDEALAPYVHPGAYFLALKLRKGQDAGDIQPVVVEYESELPMIPIILTRVAAAEDMGILAYVLGDARAVPRNYHHVEINDEHIDWTNGAKNYADVVGKAIDEAENRQAFVTEFSGPTASMANVLDAPGRFGQRGQLEEETHAADYLALLRANGFQWAYLVPILQRHFSYPAAAAGAGVDEKTYYERLPELISTFDPDASFDPVALTAELWERIVIPSLAAGRLFRDNSKMTRLLTILSPDEMTKDPAFGFNPELPDVNNVHGANLVSYCDEDQIDLQLEDSRTFILDGEDRWADRTKSPAPYAARVEILREEGPSEIVVDNHAKLTRSDGAEGGGCKTARGSSSGGGASLLFLLSAVAIARRAQLC